MPENELRNAVESIVGLLRKTQVQQAISHFRTAIIRNEKSDAAKRLAGVGNQLVSAFSHFDSSQKRVCQYMHIDCLGSQKYWQELLSVSNGLEKTRAEVVQLYSRVMFAANHLPGLVNMIEASDSVSPAEPAQGNALLKIRLVDAGEKASDPDRISRTIDGIDMVYTASVSLAKKPAIDLSVNSLSGQPEKYLEFEGDIDGVNAVKTVIDSIADEVANIEDIENFDATELISNLPIFDDLKTLQKLGTFRKPEANQIAESMREGCLLIMESGVMLEPKRTQTEKNNKVIVLPVESQATTDQSPKIELTSNQTAKNSVESSTQTNAEATGIREPSLPKLDKEELQLSTSGSDRNAIPTVTLKSNSVAKTNEPETADTAGQKNVADMSPDEFYQQYLKEKNKMKTAAANEEEAMQQISEKFVAGGGSSKADALNELISDLDKITRK